MEEKDRKRRVVVLVPFPYQGHINPMLQLGNILHSRGFSIVVAHAKMNSPDPSKYPEFVFRPLSDNLSNFDTSFHNIFSVMLTLNKNCKAPLENLMGQLLENQKDHDQVVGVIYDAIMFFVEEVAANLKIPSIVLRTGMAAYVQSYHYILQIRAGDCIPFPASKMQDNVPELPPLLFKDLPIQPTSEISEQLKDFLLRLVGIHTSVAIIWNSIDYLENVPLTQLQHHYKVRFFPVGPLHKMASSASTYSFLKEDLNCVAWLDKQASDSVLYISFGSMAIIDREELREIAWALAKSSQPFLWVIRPSSVDGAQWDELLPEGFKEIVGERGRIVKWAPQKQVLSHPAVGGFWSHCGWNSTLESIFEGVPMICTPRFADQMINARYLIDVWKVGLEIENVKDREAIERTISRLIVDDEWKEMRQRMMEMKANAEAAMEKGGSSYQALNDLTEFISSFSLAKE